MSVPSRTYVAVVDDDESARRALSRLLRADGIVAVAYASAEAFLADTKRPQFDCLVLDIRLGGLSGIELQQQLGASGSSIPVIFVTGHDDPATRTQALAVGCAGFFSKATPGHTVLRAIRGATHPGE